MSASTEVIRAVPEPRHERRCGRHRGAARESVVLIVALGFVVSSVFVLLWPYC